MRKTFSKFGKGVLGAIFFSYAATSIADSPSSEFVQNQPHNIEPFYQIVDGKTFTFPSAPTAEKDNTSATSLQIPFKDPSKTPLTLSVPKPAYEPEIVNKIGSEDPIIKTLARSLDQQCIGQQKIPAGNADYQDLNWLNNFLNTAEQNKTSKAALDKLKASGAVFCVGETLIADRPTRPNINELPIIEAGQYYGLANTPYGTIPLPTGDLLSYSLALNNIFSASMHDGREDQATPMYNDSPKIWSLDMTHYKMSEVIQLRRMMYIDRMVQTAETILALKSEMSTEMQNSFSTIKQQASSFGEGSIIDILASIISDASNAIGSNKDQMLSQKQRREIFDKAMKNAEDSGVFKSIDTQTALNYIVVSEQVRLKNDNFLPADFGARSLPNKLINIIGQRGGQTSSFIGQSSAEFQSDVKGLKFALDERMLMQGGLTARDIEMSLIQLLLEIEEGLYGGSYHYDEIAPPVRDGLAEGQDHAKYNGKKYLTNYKP